MSARSALAFSPGAAGPLLDDPPVLSSWRDRAACAGVDPELFFDDDTREAVALCARCPVRIECLSFALANRIEHGTWGGVTEEERRAMSVPDIPRYCTSGQHIMDAANRTPDRRCRACRRERDARKREEERVLRTGSPVPRSGFWDHERKSA